MAWLSAAGYEHEGWVALLRHDGRPAVTTWGEAADGQCDVLAPWRQVASWRVICRCGWTGPELPAVEDDRGTRQCPEHVQEVVMRPAWEAHVAPYARVAELAGLVQQIHDLEGRITAQVGRARAAGASWSQVGNATGITRQGAQQRWGGHEQN